MPAEYWSHPVKENDGAGVVSWGFPHKVKVRIRIGERSPRAIQMEYNTPDHIQIPITRNGTEEHAQTQRKTES